MANGRRGVQQRHERHTVEVFLAALNGRHRAHFRVVEEPNPPEAIIRSRRTTRWVEVVTAYWSEAFAKDVHSHATEGERHEPIGNGCFTNMTPEFAERFATVIKQKLEKTSYVHARETFGPGYLVVSIQFPFYGKETPHFMRRALAGRTIADLGCFRSIYLVYRHLSGYKVCRWRDK